MNKRILFVDDDVNILASHQRNLRKQFAIETALGPDEGLAALTERGPFAVIVADMQMPGMNGVQFLIKAQETAPDSVRLMLTGNADQKTATDAVNQGQVFRFLTKPCSTEEMTLTLNAALNQHQLITAERELLENTLNGSVKLLTDVLSAISPQSFGRARKLRDLMQLYCRFNPSPNSWEYELAAMLASIGLVTIPPSILQKSRDGMLLSESEKSMLSRVPEIGRDLLANIPRLEPVAQIVLYQNKNFDGTGFPRDPLSGENIPFGARILRVLSDFLDLEERCNSRPAVLAEMQKFVGKYDLRLLNSIAACFDVYLPTVARGQTDVEELMVNELQAGHLLKSDILSSSGALIVPAGTRISEMLLVKLLNFAQIGGIEEPISVKPLPKE